MTFDQIHALKIKLEKTFKPEIKKQFAKTLNAMTEFVLLHGVPQATRKQLAEWESILDNHYVRCQKLFDPRRKKKETDDSDEAERAILLALLLWREQNARSSAFKITETTRKHAYQAIRQARELLIEQGVTSPSNAELSKTAKELMRKKFNGRVSTIAMVETQSASETTRFEWAGSEMAEPDIKPTKPVPAIVKVFKVWATRLDKRVRAGHKSVEGQRRLKTEPFDVMGERLLRPGDTSLGATMKNVSGCRCASLYSW